MQEKTIQTEVDRLVTLVHEEGRISIKKAARRLNMPVSTITEWASFLEEEGIINIEYKFTTPFLVKRKLSQEQIEEIKKDVKEEKNIFDRKSESTLNYLNKLETEVDNLKDIFNDLGKHFKRRFSDVKKQFNKLKKAQDEKEKLDKHIIDSKQRFIKIISDINKQLFKEQTDCRTIYDLLYNQSKMGSQILGIQEDELKLIEKTDMMLNKKLKELKRKLDRKKSAELKSKGKMAKKSESNLHALEKKYMKLKEFLNNERAIIEKLLKENQDQDRQIEILKKDVLSKMMISDSKINKTITEINEVPKKLKLFMSKKDKIFKILNGVSYNERMLKEKLVDLMKRGSAINLSENYEDIISEINELEKNLEEISSKRGFFEREIKKIFGLLKSK
ncbi:hypothetical protein KY342_00700 [Candidatus Woesearchaeota archaeon]|nr:hypothetical protein [Candidatus Woesearchaeota archaeon]